MKIDILCTHRTHPVWPYLVSWGEVQSETHRIRLLEHVADASGGDVLFLISCNEMVRADVRVKYRFVLVLHASELPQGRGWSPHIWQVLEGRHRITVTMIEAVDKIDEGPVFAREVFVLKGHELCDEINKKLFAVELKLMDFAVDHFGTMTAIPQPEEVPSYYRKRTVEDSRLDTEKTIAEQFNLLRVADADRFPSFFDFRGCRYKVVVSKMDGADVEAG